MSTHPGTVGPSDLEDLQSENDRLQKQVEVLTAEQKVTEESTVQKWLDGMDRRFNFMDGVPRQIEYPRKKKHKYPRRRTHE